MSKITFVSLILSLAFIVGCQATQPAVTPATPTTAVMATKVEILPTNTILAASTEESTPDRVKTAVSTATSTTIPQPTETATPTPLPTNTPTPDPVWSILFTGNPCSATASDCSPSPDSPPSENYFIYSDGTELQLLSEVGLPYTWEDAATMADNVEAFQLSPDQSRAVIYTGEKFLLGDVGGDTYSEVAANISHFYPFSFYGDDPNCLAGFDDELENGEIVVSLYKSCIGDIEPALVDKAVLPIDHTRLQYSLSPKGNKWLVYDLGLFGGDAHAALYVKEVMGDSNVPQQIFQEEFASCTHSVHWQDNETIEFLFSNCLNNDLATYFYVIDWTGQEFNLRYALPTVEIPPSESYASTRYFGPATGDWYADDNFFIFSPSSTGSLPPEYNGLYILNLITGEVQQILSDTGVFTINAWLPATTNVED